MLQGRGAKETALIEAARAFARPAGSYRIRIHYRSLAGVPARLQPLIESIYRRSRYQRSIDYGKPLAVALSEADSASLRQLLAAREA